ncbi:MAG: sigma-70 family RNA polymerase sigma factor [Eubacteriales bacterium]|nr:sigma-70 family RNA polymerase sigma factor [Eubacteriales bacterium]
MNGALVPGDVQELERLMAQYGDSLLRMCYALLHDRELARDATQESFLKAYRALGSLRSGETEKAWLMRIAINTCKDMRRSRWWRMIDRRVTPEDLPEAGREDDLPDEQPLLAVMNLPEKERQVVLLHYYQGMTLEEIAQTLDSPASTVRTRLMRARRGLRTSLKGWYYDEESLS